MAYRQTGLGEELRSFARRFAWVAAYFTVAALIGTIGFQIIEDWPWLDALYMSVTTLASVGFMEVRPLSSSGRVFTMGLVVAGVTGLGLFWGLTTALIVELDLGGLLRRRRIMSRIDEMSDHFIVCGGGRMGRVLLEELRASDRPYVLVEHDNGRVEKFLKDYPELCVVEGDATMEHTLKEAGIERAGGLAACLGEDADNLLVCLTARGLRSDLTIVSRAYSEESLEKMRRAGADHVISPNITSGVRMASMLLRPHVVSFLDAATTGPDDVALHLEEVGVDDDSPLAGRTLGEARIPQRAGLIVLAVRKGGMTGEAHYNPGSEIRLETGDVVIVLGRLDQIARLRDYVRGKLTPGPDAI